ncbi:MAG: alpha/beta hydrolase [Planctomycetota bacterium]
MRILSNASVLACVVVFAGCAPKMMETPTLVSEGLVDPFGGVLPERRTTSVPVFVASAREATGESDPKRFYTNERSRIVRLGVAEVALGEELGWDGLVKASRQTKRDANPTLKVLNYKEFGPLQSTALRYGPPESDDGPGSPAAEFADEINAVLAESQLGQITIFVHGFNTTFAGNLITAAEFTHYMARDGVLVSFGWASKGNVFSYHQDKANADFAIRQFRLFLEYLAASTDARQINIIAHSAGNPITIEAMRHLSLKHDGVPDEEVQRITKLGRVVLAAPDIDFESALSASFDGATRIAEDVVLYASQGDLALQISSDIFGDIRLGSVIGKLSPEEVEGIIERGEQNIDVTYAEKAHSSLLGHSYYHHNPWVSSDVMLFLLLGPEPEERGLVLNRETGFYEFPPDYEENLPVLVEELRVKYADRLRREEESTLTP